MANNSDSNNEVKEFLEAIEKIKAPLPITFSKFESFSFHGRIPSSFSSSSKHMTEKYLLEYCVKPVSKILFPVKRK